MEKDQSVICANDSSETWTKTMELRFILRENFVGNSVTYIQVLQQQSISSSGNIKWEDIQIEIE